MDKVPGEGMSQGRDDNGLLTLASLSLFSFVGSLLRARTKVRQVTDHRRQKSPKVQYQALPSIPKWSSPALLQCVSRRLAQVCLQAGPGQVPGHSPLACSVRSPTQEIFSWVLVYITLANG